MSDYDDGAPLPEPPDEFDDAPPADDWWEAFEEPAGPAQPAAAPPTGHTRQTGNGRRPGTRNVDVDLADMIVREMRRTLAGTHMASAEDLHAVVSLMYTADAVFEEVDPITEKRLRGVLSLIAAEYTTLGDSTLFDLHDMPALAGYSDEIAAEVTAIRAVQTSGDVPANPTATWLALREEVQATRSRRGLARLIDALDSKETPELKMKLFAELPPPTTRQTGREEHRSTRTARQILEDRRADLAGRPPVRYSSGFRTIDVAFTAGGEPLGLIAPGQQIVLAGPTGTGKSSISYSLIRAMAQDALNQGSQGRVILFHTEEENYDKARYIGLDRNARFSHLADSIIVEPVGSSRRRIVEVLYDEVVRADALSREMGMPITEFLPPVAFVDYIQAILEPGEDTNRGVIRTAELILRGIQAWNPEEMAKWAGLSFQEYTGQPWPKGQETHRVSVVTFAQLRKPEDHLHYKAGDKHTPLSEFTKPADGMAGLDNPWFDEKGNPWAWEVREGDYRLIDKAMVEGTGKILQNATMVFMLHRSTPDQNPARPEPGTDGRMHLMDTRSRILFDKARNGIQMLFAPMTFDIGASSAQYFDSLGERWVEHNRHKVDDVYRQAGDPILPRRSAQSPLAGCPY